MLILEIIQPILEMGKCKLLAVDTNNVVGVYVKS